MVVKQNEKEKREEGKDGGQEKFEIEWKLGRRESGVQRRQNVNRTKYSVRLLSRHHL